MSESDLAIMAALVFAWGTLSARLERFDVTAPIIFVLAGVLLTHGPLAVLSVTPTPELVKGLAEATLVLVLFSDASRVGLRELRADAGLYGRLLGIGLPLTIGLGTLLALALFGGMSIWLALLVGAALAPTDAALGAGMIVNPAVPAGIRRLINVESGLNDGIATPFVLVALAGAQTAEHAHATGPGKAVAELAVGLAIGVAVGGVGGWLVSVARRRGWAAEGFAGPAVLGLAICAYASALALHGNGFIAAFTGGLAYGAMGGQRGARLVPFVEETGALVSLLVWLAFGAVAVAAAAAEPDLAGRAVCGAQLDGDPDGAGSDRAGGGAAGPRHCRPGGLVRAAGPGLGGVRAAGPGGPRPARRQPGGRRDHRHRAAQRGRARRDRRSAGPAVRAAARPGRGRR